MKPIPRGRLAPILTVIVATLAVAALLDGAIGGFDTINWSLIILLSVGAGLLALASSPS